MVATKTNTRVKKTLPLPKDKAQARVAVAKDVIARIQAKRLRAKRGRYVFHASGVDCEPNVDDIEANCKVCALGACILSFTRLYNHFDLGYAARKLNTLSLLQRDDIEGDLRRIFTVDQLDLIESAFERDQMGQYRYTWPVPQPVADAVKFGSKFRDAEDRLLAIMQNVVDHKGSFKPKVQYEIYMKRGR